VLSLRLYNPVSRQWSLNSANVTGGTMSVPTVGEFKNGRGEFYDWEEIGGRMVLVRNVWSDISAKSCTFEQAFSDDGGKTWEVNWVAVDTRIPDAKEPSLPTNQPVGVVDQDDVVPVEHRHENAL
jgi:hypothetical protein